MMTKQELRQLMRQRRQQHLADNSVPHTGELLRNEHFASARTLLLYSALPGEVPTQPLLDRLVAEGKTVVLPRVISSTDMELRRYTGMGDLQEGAFGIMEPTGPVFTDYSQIDVAVIPGMAFDHAGHRLGRGKGYYDRFLSRIPMVYRIGVCFSWQLVEHVPADGHDVLMNCVIVEK